MAVLNLNLIVSQVYLPNSEWFVQTYPLWHLIISQNHVFDCFPLSSDSNCRQPVIQQRQSNDGLTIILVHSQCTSSIKFYRTHFICKTINIQHVSSIVFRENYYCTINLYWQIAFLCATSFNTRRSKFCPQRMFIYVETFTVPINQSYVLLNTL